MFELTNEGVAFSPAEGWLLEVLGESPDEVELRLAPMTYDCEALQSERLVSDQDMCQATIDVVAERTGDYFMASVSEYEWLACDGAYTLQDLVFEGTFGSPGLVDYVYSRTVDVRQFPPDADWCDVYPTFGWECVACPDEAQECLTLSEGGQDAPMSAKSLAPSTGCVP